MGKVAFLLAITSCFVGAQAAGAPELPPLNVRSFAPPIRDQIQEAYLYAKNHAHDAAASGRLGMTFHAYGLLQEATTCYRRAAELQPNEFRWSYYLGLAEADQGQCKQASSELRSALRLNPDYVPAKLRLADCLLASAELEEGGKLYNDIINRDPDNPEAYYGLGRVRARRHDYAGAIEAYQKAIALFPDFGAAHYALALAYRALGEDRKAQEELPLFEKTKSSVPSSADQLLADIRALNRSSSYQVQLGAELEREGKLEESAAAHEKALEIDPNLVQAHINLIRLYGQLGHFEQADQHYRAAIRIDASSAEAYYNYGVLLLGAQRYDAAENAFRKTIDTDPYYADAHNNLGYLLERRGNFSEAAAEYKKAIENKPSDRQAHFNLGRILVNQQKYGEGIQELKKTIEPDDENTPRYLYALGAAFARSGDRQSALRYIRQARDSAAARGQVGLLASIDRDLRALETPGTSQ